MLSGSRELPDCARPRSFFLRCIISLSRIWIGCGLRDLLSLLARRSIRITAVLRHKRIGVGHAASRRQMIAPGVALICLLRRLPTTRGNRSLASARSGLPRWGNPRNGSRAAAHARYKLKKAPGLDKIRCLILWRKALTPCRCNLLHQLTKQSFITSVRLKAVGDGWRSYIVVLYGSTIWSIIENTAIENAK